MTEQETILRLLNQSGAMLVTRDYCEFDHHSVTLEVPHTFGSPVEPDDFQALVKAGYVDCRDPEDLRDFGRHNYTITDAGKQALAAGEGKGTE